MQSQAQQQHQELQTVNATQSLAYVKTLLQAGLGCITYLRNLLPADNFSDRFLTCDSQGHGGSQSFDGGSGRSGVRMMTVNRGFTDEADKLLDYLENGIFDALEKQYLRSFIFAIFLDDKDPNNIVEAYTFNVHYHKVPGGSTIPILSLGEDLEQMSLRGKQRERDPAAEASKRGRVPTLGEVQKSLKQLIKTLIQATTHMETLPRRRYATFKLFYTAHTPADYEPVHFRAGDVERDRFFFATHGMDEPPEKSSIGRLETGHHGIHLEIQSVAAYLPSSEDVDALFTGTIAGATTTGPGAAPGLTPVEEAAHRAQQAVVQAQDAASRVVVWAAEADVEANDPEADAHGEDDPEYAGGVFVGSKDGAVNVDDSGVAMGPAVVPAVVPLGIRNAEGEVVPVPPGRIAAEVGARGAGGADVDGMDVGSVGEEAQYAGMSEDVPLRAGALRLLHLPVGDLTQTQEMEPTQQLPSSPTFVPQTQTQTHSRRYSARLRTSSTVRSFSSAPDHAMSDLSSLPPSSIGTHTPTPYVDPRAAATVDTQMLMDMVLNTDVGTASETTQDSEMLDMETQIQSADNDPIESFSAAAAPNEGIRRESEDHGLACNCGVDETDVSCFCEGGCGRWFHVWCMGYHSAEDPRLPHVFNCFECRIRQDKNWAMIAVNDLLPNMTAKFGVLALFRRSIKIAEMCNPDTLAKFTKELGCEVVVAGQLFKRLETEGFIGTETSETDDTGLLTTRTRLQHKQKSRARKEIQRAKYYFVQASKTGQAYLDYFNPDIDVERRMMGLSQTDVRPRMHRKLHLAPSLKEQVSSDLPVQASSSGNPPEVPLPPIDENESQTQDYTQVPDSPLTSRELKRKPAATRIPEPRKKTKISMGPAVDLQD